MFFLCGLRICVFANSLNCLYYFSRGTKRKRKVPSRYITEEEEITDRATKEILLSDKTRKEPSLSPIEVIMS